MNEPPAHEPSAPGGRTAIGRYEILRDLGHGGMGSVHLAHDTQLRRQVALKLLLPERIERQDARLRFEREVHALSRLDHPNLCRLYDAGEVDGMPYLAMQFVAGETLAAAIESAFEGTKPLPGGAAPTRGATGELLPDRGAIQHLLTLFEKLARALHVAHQDGIVHRDIKPSNIMLAENGEPVLLDFGLALDEQGTGPSLTASDQSLGTPLYMAPEQVQPGRHPVDARTDVHGLAVTLYHALTLHAPFGGLTNHQIYQRILKEDARDPRALHPGIDRDLAIVLQTALAKEPAHRYRDAATFAEDLRRVRVREPILAKPPTVPERLVRWSQRNPLVAAFLGTVVLLLGAVSASLVTTSRALDAESIALQQSEDARTEMRTSIGYFNRLATIEDLRRATDEAKQLFPAWPEREADLESWLERRAAPLVAQLEAFRTELAALQAMPLAETAAPASLVTAERIEASTRAYLLQLMQENLPALEQAIGSEQGIVAQVRRRLHAARTVAVETLRHPGWPAASAAVRTDPRFAELDLVPQTDLVPLGADPVSGLQEFLHMPSHPDGEPPPARDPATGQVAWTERTGIVFVLVPGGTATMGAQQVDPAAPFHDPLAEEDEILHQVTLAPYLLSKFEMTQAQWERLAGANPSMFQPSYNATLPPPRKLPGGREASVTPFTLRHPVEQVTWEQCAEILRQQGLVLPTEAQWEHACRAGTTTPWYCAEDQLQFHANLPDQFSVFFTNGSYGNYHDWSDDHVAHAPVGSYRPNPFGLFDMHGNVGEWCQDPLLPYTNSVRAGDGLREPRDGDPLANQMYRGGDFRFLARESRSSNRLRSNRINEMGNTLGLRPARAILGNHERK